MPRIRAAVLVVIFSLFSLASVIAQDKPAASPDASAAQVVPTQTQTVPEAPAEAPLIPPKEPSVLGELEIITLNSKVYKNIRNLRVWLPANYFAPVNRNKHYPVLYMQDGQNLFDEATAFYHEWKFDESVQFLTGSMRIGPMIVVGIDSTPRRANEYLPYGDPNNKELGKLETQDVQGKQYGDFVIKEVLKDAEKATKFPEKMYVAIGTAEDSDEKTAEQNVDAVNELEKILRAKGLGLTKLKVVVEEGAKRDEIAWSKRLQAALLFLYASDIHLLKEEKN
jgi:predicted alpha/beta superfamily hydrolase